MIIELLENENNSKSEKYYVQIKVNGHYENLCENKSTTCGYSEFKSRILNYIDRDAVEIFMHDYKKRMSSHWWRKTIFTGFMIVAMIYAAIYAYRKYMPKEKKI